MTNKLRTAFLLLYLITWDSAVAQQVTDTCYKSFFRIYKDPSGYTEFKDICRTSDGGYAAVGRTRGGPPLIKTDNKGNIIWAKMFPGLVWSNKILRTKDGNFVVTTFTMYEGSHLSKFTNEGQLIWSKKYDNPGISEMQISDIKETRDSGFIMTFNASYGFPPLHTYILRVDSSGNAIWKKAVGNIFYSSPVFRSLLVDNDDFFPATSPARDVA